MIIGQIDMKKDKILVTGGLGQIGSELSSTLMDIYGAENVIVSDIKSPAYQNGMQFETLDVLDAKALGRMVDHYGITQIYHLAAILSANGEKFPLRAWDINMKGTLSIFELAREKQLDKIYYPSSIAVFGADSPKVNTPQDTIMNPSTVYGMSKLSGEQWSAYYFNRYGLDIRSLRYPGVISYKTPPGGGTTDYAVDIFYKALENKVFECFLASDMYLPMMYMPDAIRATIELMQADSKQLNVRTSYNLSAFSFSPADMATSIQRHIPEFEIKYSPDFRQEIAASWPDSIDDGQARLDWAWKPAFDLDSMVEDMLDNLAPKLQENKKLVNVDAIA